MSKKLNIISNTNSAPVNNSPIIPPDGEDTSVVKAIVNNKNKDELQLQKGYVEPEYETSIKEINDDPSFRRNMYKHFLDKNNDNLIPYNNTKDLYLKSAQSQSFVNAALNTINPISTVKKLGNRIIGDIANMGQSLHVFDNNWDKPNYLSLWSEENIKKMEDNGDYSLTNTPDELLGDSKAILRMWSDSDISMTAGLAEGFGIGKLVGGTVKIAGSMLDAAANLEMVAAKTGQMAGSIGMTSAMASMQGQDAYNKVVVDYMKHINPNTGLFYTEQEAHSQGLAAQKTAFYSTILIGSLLNMVGLEGLIAPEAKIEQQVAKDIEGMTAKSIAEEDINKSLENMHNAEGDVVESSKKIAKKVYGVRKTLASGISGYAMVDANKFATDLGVSLHSYEHKKYNTKINYGGLLAKSFFSKEGLVNGLGGFLGSVSTHLFMGLAPINLKAIFQNEFLYRDEDGRPVYIKSNVTDKNTYLEPDKNLIDGVVSKETDRDEYEFKTIKKPIKPNKYLLDNVENPKYSEQLKIYNEKISEWRKLKLKEFTKSNYKRMKETYIDSFKNATKVYSDVYENMNDSLNKIKDEVGKKNKKQEYSQDIIDDSRENMYNALSYLHLMQNSEKALMVTLNAIKNTSPKDMFERGLIENVKDTSYKNKIDKTIQDLKFLAKKRDEIRMKYKTNENLMNGFIADTVFSIFKNKYHYNRVKNKRNKSLLENTNKSNLDLETINNLIDNYFKYRYVKNDNEEAKTMYKYISDILHNNISKYSDDSPENKIIKKIIDKKLKDVTKRIDKYKTYDAIKEKDNLNKKGKELEEKINEYNKEVDNAKNTEDIEKLKTKKEKLDVEIKNHNEETKKYNDTIKKLVDNDDLISSHINNMIAEMMSDMYDEIYEDINKQENVDQLKNIKSDEIQKMIIKKLSEIKEKEAKRKEENDKKDAEDELQKKKNKEEEEKKGIIKEIGTEKTNDLFDAESHIKNMSAEIDNLLKINKEKTGNSEMEKEIDLDISNLKHKLDDIKNKIKSKDNNGTIIAIKKYNELKEKIINKLSKYSIEKKNNEYKPKIKNGKSIEDVLGEDFTKSKDILDNLSSHVDEKLFKNNGEKINDNVDRAVTYTIDKSELEDIKHKFSENLFNIYKKWIENVSIENTDINSPEHFKEFYKFLEYVHKTQNKAVLKDMYESVLVDLLKNVGSSRANYGKILDGVVAINFSGQTPDSNIITNSDRKVYKNEENTIQVNDDTKYENNDAINNGNKNKHPSGSIAYNERESIKIDIDGRIHRVEIEDVSKTSIQDELAEGDILHFKVLDNDDIKVELPNGTISTWGEVKKDNENNKDFNTYEHVPIAILNENDDIVGFIHDSWWIEKKGLNVAESTDAEQEISDNNKIRKYIYENKNTKSKVDKINNGILNKSKDGETKTLSEAIPNLEESGGKLTVFRNGEISLSKDVTEENIVNIDSLKKMSPEGAVLILFPTANNESYIADFANIPFLDVKDSAIPNSIMKLTDEILNGRLQMSLNDYIKFIKSFIYTKHFEFKDLTEYIEDNDKSGSKKYFFNITKSGDLEFAHVDKNLYNSWDVFRINLSGNRESMFEVSKRGEDGNFSEYVPVRAEDSNNVLLMMREIIKHSRLNVNLDMLNNNDKFNYFLYIGDNENGNAILKKYEYKNYRTFISKFLTTDVIEKHSDDGKLHKYTIQQVINFKNEHILEKVNNEIKPESENNNNDENIITHTPLNSKKEKQYKVIDNKIYEYKDGKISDKEVFKSGKNRQIILNKLSEGKSENNTKLSKDDIKTKNEIDDVFGEDNENEEYEDEEYDDFDEAVLFDKNSIENLNDGILTTKTGIDIEHEQSLINNIIFDITNKFVSNKLIENGNVDSYFDEIEKTNKKKIGILNKVLSEYDENEWNDGRNKLKEKYGVLTKYTYNEMIKQNMLYKSFLENKEYYKQQTLNNIGDLIKDAKDEIIKDEESEIERKPQWDIINNSIDVNKKSSFKMKFILSSIPECKFKLDEDGNIKLKNGKPIIIYKKDIIGNKLQTNSKNLSQKIHNILIDISHISDNIKFDSFIDVLKNSNDASLYLFANTIERMDDNTKASFLNVMSTQETNEHIVLFKSDWRDLTKKEYEEQENEMMLGNRKYINKKKLVNIVFNSKSSNKTEIDNIIRDLFLEAKSNMNSEFLHKDNNGKTVIDFDKLKYYDELFSNNKSKVTLDDLYKIMNNIGMNINKKEFNSIFKNDKLLSTVFSFEKVKNYNDLLRRNSVIHLIIKSILSLGNDIDVLSVNPLQNVNKATLREIAKLKLYLSDRYGTTTYKNINGDTVQSISFNTMLSKTLNDLKSEGSKMLNKLSSVSSTMTGLLPEENRYKSFWIKNLNNNNSSLFDVGMEGGMTKWSKYSNGKMKFKMNKDELLLYKIFNFINNSSEKTFSFSPLTYSDKKSSNFIIAPRYELDFGDNILIKNHKFMKLNSNGKFDIRSLNKMKDALWYYLLLPEISRINKHVDAMLNKETNFDKLPQQEIDGGFYFYFVPELNKNLDLRDKNSRIILNNDNKKIMLDTAFDMVEKDVAKHYELFKKMFIKDVKIKGKTIKRLDLISNKFMDKKYPYDRMDIEDKIQLLAIDFAFNNQLATAEYTKVLGSDFTSTYKTSDKNVLNKSIIDDIRSGNTNKTFKDVMSDNTDGIIKNVTSTIKEYTKRQAKDIAPRMDGYWIDKENRNLSNYTQLYITEKETSFYDNHYKAHGITGYNKVEGSDAIEYGTLKEQIITSHAYGNISDDVYYKMMKAIDDTQNENKKIIEKMESDGKSHKEILDAIKPTKIPEELKSKLLLTSTKPVTAGNKFNDVLGRKTTNYIKVSTLPLLYDVFGNSEIKYLIKQAEYLESKYNTSVRIALKSGTKEGAINVKSIWDINKKDKTYEMNIDSLSDLNGEKMSRINTGIQLEEPVDEIKTRINTVTQANKLLFVGLLDGYNTEDGSLEGFKFNNEEYSAEQLKDLKENIKKQLVINSRNDLFNELGLEFNEDNEIKLKNKKAKQQFIGKLKNIIIKEMINRNYNISDKNMIELINSDTFKYPLSFIPKSSKIEALLLSIITNRIIKTKLPGKNYINAPGTGIMTFNPDENFISDMVFTENYNNKNLKYIVFSKDGKKIERAQCFVSFNFTDNKGDLLDMSKYIVEKNGKKYLDIGDNKELLNLVGLRIPNQGHSSMLLLEIAGFLPEYMKNIIVLPPEITAQMGSDNDYDHLYTYSYNTDISLNKDEIDNITKETNDKFSYENYEGDENYKSMKNEYEKLVTKYSDENIKKIKKELNSEEKSKLDELKNNDKLYEFDKTKKQDLKGVEKSLKIKLEKYNREYHNIKKENKDKILFLKNELKNERIKNKKKYYKKAISDKRLETGELKKLNYSDNLEENNTLQLQNMYVDVFNSVLSNPKVAIKMLSPLDLPYLGDESKKLSKIMSDDEIVNPLSSLYSIDSYINNQIGKSGVARQSLVSSFIALSEDKNLKLKDKIINYFPIKFKYNGEIHTIDGAGIGKHKLESGKIIDNSTENMMYQSEAVDNAKNLNLKGLNYNNITAPIYNTLMVLITKDKTSIPMETLSRLMNQPILIDFVKEISGNKNLFDDYKSTDENKTFMNISKKYFKMANKLDENLDYSDEIINKVDDFYIESRDVLLNMIKRFSNGEQTKDDYLYQSKLAYFMADVYSTYVKQIDSLIVKISGIDSKSIGKNILEMKNRHDSILKSIHYAPFENTDDLIDGTEIGTIFKNSFNVAEQLYLNKNILDNAIFEQNSILYNNVMGGLSKRYGVDLDYVETSKKVWNALKQYIYSRVFEKTFSDVNIQDERKRLLYGDSSLALRTLNYREQKWFKNNSFLSQLNVDTNNNLILKENNKFSLQNENNKAMFVKYDSYKKDTNRDYILLNDFAKEFIKTQKELNEKPNDIEIGKKMDYLEDVIKYTILEGGVQNSQNWIKFIHPDILEMYGILHNLRIFHNFISNDETLEINKQIMFNNTKLLKSVSGDFIDVPDFASVKFEKYNNVNELSTITINRIKLMQLYESEKGIFNDILSYEKFYMDIGNLDAFKYYDKQNKKFIYMMLNYELSDENNIVYTRANKLGTEKLGVVEYGRKIDDSMIDEEKDNFVKNQNEKYNIIPDGDNDFNYNKFEVNPSKETAFETLHDMYNSPDEAIKTITNIIFDNKNLYKDTMFIDSEIGNRGETHYDSEKNAKSIILNIKEIKSHNNNNKFNTEEEYNEVLLHEMLHPIFKKFIYNLKNNNVSDESIAFYNELENFRKEVFDKMKEKNPILYERYLKEKQEGEYSKDVVFSFVPLENVSEMLSYGWSNKYFQKHLFDTELDSENKSAYEKLKSYLSDILNSIAKSLGIKSDKNAMYQFVDKSLKFYDSINELSDKKNVNNSTNYSGENISPKGSEFAKKLTNIGNDLTVEYKGKIFKNAEHAYQTWKSGKFNQSAYDEGNAGKFKPTGKNNIVNKIDIDDYVPIAKVGDKFEIKFIGENKFNEAEIVDYYGEIGIKYSDGDITRFNLEFHNKKTAQIKNLQRANYKNNVANKGDYNKTEISKYNKGNNFISLLSRPKSLEEDPKVITDELEIKRILRKIENTIKISKEKNRNLDDVLQILNSYAVYGNSLGARFIRKWVKARLNNETNLKFEEVFRNKEPLKNSYQTNNKLLSEIDDKIDKAKTAKEAISTAYMYLSDNINYSKVNEELLSDMNEVYSIIDSNKTNKEKLNLLKQHLKHVDYLREFSNHIVGRITDNSMGDKYKSSIIGQRSLLDDLRASKTIYRKYYTQLALLIENYGNSEYGLKKTNENKFKTDLKDFIKITNNHINSDKSSYQTMVDILTAKLEQHPELVKGIDKRGGMEYLNQSTHEVTGDKFWEGKDGGFMRALKDAYNKIKKTPQSKETGKNGSGDVGVGSVDTNGLNIKQNDISYENNRPKEYTITLKDELGFDYDVNTKGYKINIKGHPNVDAILTKDIIMLNKENKYIIVKNSKKWNVYTRDANNELHLLLQNINTKKEVPVEVEKLFNTLDVNDLVNKKELVENGFNISELKNTNSLDSEPAEKFYNEQTKQNDENKIPIINTHTNDEKIKSAQDLVEEMAYGKSIDEFTVEEQNKINALPIDERQEIFDYVEKNKNDYIDNAYKYNIETSKILGFGDEELSNGKKLNTNCD